MKEHIKAKIIDCIAKQQILSRIVELILYKQASSSPGYVSHCITLIQAYQDEITDLENQYFSLP